MRAHTNNLYCCFSLTVNVEDIHDAGDFKAQGCTFLNPGG
jgi:hypothetical protein